MTPHRLAGEPFLQIAILFPQEMKVRSDLIFPSILEITDVSFDQEDFWPTSDRTCMTRWNEVEELCVGYWIHSIAIVDFRLRGDTKSIWVLDEANPSFLEEIGIRFPHQEAPDLSKWNDSDHCIQTFTIWPQSRYGEPMYGNAKRTWHSFPRLALLSPRPER